mmetsp:Transcript_26636/g.42648  ORF Transcript_26636/g.42648 Transcript_26636/m.42648 type:complete len:202 (-) Transcript_26636:602-1207(-)
MRSVSFFSRPLLLQQPKDRHQSTTFFDLPGRISSRWPSLSQEPSPWPSRTPRSFRRQFAAAESTLVFCLQVAPASEWRPVAQERVAAQHASAPKYCPLSFSAKLQHQIVPMSYQYSIAYHHDDEQYSIAADADNAPLGIFSHRSHVNLMAAQGSSQTSPSPAVHEHVTPHSVHEVVHTMRRRQEVRRSLGNCSAALQVMQT